LKPFSENENANACQEFPVKCSLYPIKTSNLLLTYPKFAHNPAAKVLPFGIPFFDSLSSDTSPLDPSSYILEPLIIGLILESCPSDAILGKRPLFCKSVCANMMHAEKEYLPSPLNQDYPTPATLARNPVSKLLPPAPSWTDHHLTRLRGHLSPTTQGWDGS
jgi:hypothetical protein